MVQAIGDLEPSRALANFGDWTDRVAKGELPFAKPQRPTGIERKCGRDGCGIGRRRRRTCMI